MTVAKQVLLIAISLLASGCLTPSVRYVRPSYRKTGYTRPVRKNRDSVSSPRINTPSGVLTQSRLKAVLDSYMGIPYKFGGTSRSGIDCSGLIYRVFKDLGYRDIVRTSSRKLSLKGTAVSRRNAAPGDLVFFKKWGQVQHVGILLDGKTFAHASSSQGVIYSSLKEKYFKRHYAGIRRTTEW